MNDTAVSHDAGRDAQFTVCAGNDSGVSVPGVIAAVIWAVGLVAGLIALATGHGVLATVVLSFAVMSPWVGLAWVSRSQPISRLSEPAEALSGHRELQFTAR
jgi:hypothetical protein